MPVALGFDSKLAIVKGSTWGTAVALSTGHRMPFRSTGLDYQRTPVPNEDINSRGVQGPPDLGNSFVNGPIEISGDYRQVGHQLLAAMIIGAAGSPGAAVETGVYLHRMRFQPNTNGLFVSAGVDFGGVDVWGFNSVKPSRRVLIAQSGGRLDERYEFDGRGVDKTISSSGWTYATDPTDGGTLRVLHRHATLRINAQSGGALGSSDETPFTRVEVDISRNHQMEYAQQGQPEEPSPAGWGSVTLRVTFFGATAALMTLLRDAKDARTELKADLKFNHGVLLGATLNHERCFYFPKLVVTDAPMNIPGPGPIPFSVTMSAHAAASTPTGFTSGDTQEVIETWQNARSTDILA